MDSAKPSNLSNPGSAALERDRPFNGHNQHHMDTTSIANSQAYRPDPDPSVTSIGVPRGISIVHQAPLPDPPESIAGRSQTS